MTPNELAAATAVDYDPFAGAALTRLVPTTAAQREEIGRASCRERV